jgi:HTH-type transcriptional regulator / antitoxin HigA
MVEQGMYPFVTDVVPSPGETIKELIEEIGIPQTDLALRLGRAEKTVSQLVTGKAPLSPQTAIDLERVLGAPASFWNNAERKYRDWLARQNEQARAADMAAWAKLFPTKEMAGHGWIPQTDDLVEKARCLLVFFGVSSPASWEEYWRSPARLAFRLSPSFEADLPALTAWLRRGELEAQKVETDPYDRRRFRRALLRLRGLTRETPDVYTKAIREESAKAGVAVVFVKELPGTRCSAATFWATGNKAVIQLCLRYRTDDHLWFSFFHEAGHILLHGKRKTIVEYYDQNDSLEEEANGFAADILIPPRLYSDFLEKGKITQQRIESFAEQIAVSPSIVLGRLQHEEVVGYDRFSKLKTKLKWAS